MSLQSQEEATLLEIIHHIHRKHPTLSKSVGIQENNDFTEWKNRQYEVPVPWEIKIATLIRHSVSGAVWIETGTYRGDTTNVLAKIATKVFSLEPSKELFDFSFARFSDRENITVINDTSENCLPRLLGVMNGKLNLWLDGHYSGAGTFAGPNDTPLIAELATIDKFIENFDRCAVFIDDIRLCGRRHAYGEYPSLDYLVDWARKGHWDWHIEYDIFVAKR